MTPSVTILLIIYPNDFNDDYDAYLDDHNDFDDFANHDDHLLCINATMSIYAMTCD